MLGAQQLLEGVGAKLGHEHEIVAVGAQREAREHAPQQHADVVDVGGVLELRGDRGGQLVDGRCERVVEALVAERGEVARDPRTRGACARELLLELGSHRAPVGERQAAAHAVAPDAGQ